MSFAIFVLFVAIVALAVAAFLFFRNSKKARATAEADVKAAASTVAKKV